MIRVVDVRWTMWGYEVDFSGRDTCNWTYTLTFDSAMDALEAIGLAGRI